MDNRMTKAELIARMQAENLGLLSTLMSVPAERLEEPGVTGDWSVKDLLSHLNFWVKHSLDEMKRAVRGEAKIPIPSLPGESREDTLNRLNNENYLATSNQSRAVIRAELDQHFSDLFQLVLGLDESEFMPDSPVERLLDGEPIASVVGSDTWEHYAEHAATIREWLARS